jgi:hypothetical protein
VFKRDEVRIGVLIARYKVERRAVGGPASAIFQFIATGSCLWRQTNISCQAAASTGGVSGYRGA